MEKEKMDGDKLNELEAQVKELTKQVSKLSDMITDHMRSKNNESSLYTNRYAKQYVNPWTLAALDLGSEPPQGTPITRYTSNARYNAMRFDIYHPTINALKTTDEGYTAEEVSKQTNRTRSTESGYLNRLFRAGIIKKVRKGKRVNYVLIDRDLADKVFTPL